MRSALSKSPIASFAIPPHPPEPVAEAQAAYEELADRWATMRGEIQDAEAALIEAKAADIRDAATSYAAGKEPKETDVHQDEATTALAVLEARYHGLNAALDEAGNNLAAAIAKSRALWQKELHAAEQSAAEHYEASLADAQEALVELRQTRGAVAWLESFDYGDATVGNQGQWHGGRLRVVGKTPGALKGEHDPVDLLKLAAQAAHPPAPPQPRPLHAPPEGAVVMEAS